jgi:transposase-like protein
MARSSARRLTEEEKEGIVLGRLRGVPVRTLAEKYDTSTKTIVDTYKRYLKVRIREFEEEADAERAKIISRLERIADDARSSSLTADDKEIPRFLAEERQALAQMAKLLGLDVQKVEHAGEINGGLMVVRIVEEVPGDA